MPRPRFRDLGFAIGRIPPGPLNAITDVAGVRVGHATIVRGDGALVVGAGPVRTGVTVVVPHEDEPWGEPVFAGCHRLNGNGELTGLEWIREAGLLGGVIGLTNTHSVGVVRDALVAEGAEARRDGIFWSLPVVGETYDGALNDMDGFHVTPDHVRAAIASAAVGAVAEGNVGGGTGMICHEFKGGIGTASRRLPTEAGGWTVGVLVQANYGSRELLRIDGVPVGAAIPTTDVPSPWDAIHALEAGRAGPEGGSIIVIVATDAPLLPHQCTRLAQRPSLALGRMGSYASNGSGDLFLAFATGNRGLSAMADGGSGGRTTVDLRAVGDGSINPLFEATVEATEEAIVNALLGAVTMTGRDGITAHALDPERLVGVFERFGRLPSPAG
ncbi:MAG TPA: P1 family peptidase [Candidatus Limnocylindrales bacterium]|nr:P1 family peptidase [Candidatus Limnocylindrales bacterium]